MDLIQILPVNDTGGESSPYSARSAFALNPVYIRLQGIEGAKTILGKSLKEAQALFAERKKIPYEDAARFKRRALLAVFDAQYEKIAADKKLQKWIADNDWVKSYAVYCHLKIENSEASWRDWKKHQNPTAKQIHALWVKHARETLFQAWMQFVAEEQFLKAVQALDAMGVRLMGDIPILINEDSADVWGSRAYFDLDNSAGAPPDMFSHSGQNWGFPTYRWDALEKDNYGWWRERLVQASKFYHAYRIDHVLGFFRIWSVPRTEVTGILGRFNPSRPIPLERLQSAGFQSSTLDYLTHPNFDRNKIASEFGAESSRVISRYFEPLPSENHRLKLRAEYASERAIISLEEPQEIKDALLRVYWDRVFIPLSDGRSFWPYWYWYSAPVFSTLPEHEQHKLRAVIVENEAGQENLWRETGKKLLEVMVNTTDMLACAEDLGVVPDCVPEVLQELKILSLRVERWARDWKAPGQPYIPVSQYPRLSVCTTSCHDSSTLRGLWNEEGFDRSLYWHAQLKQQGDAPSAISPDTAAMILEHILCANSLLAVLPLQDFTALDSGFQKMETSDEERINIPGTVGPHNWSWKMPCSIEELSKAKKLNQKILTLITTRAKRTVV
jgi:4-alpha-glucanotransferase